MDGVLNCEYVTVGHSKKIKLEFGQSYIQM